MVIHYLSSFYILSQTTHAQTIRTKTVESNVNPKWNELLVLPAPTAPASNPWKSMLSFVLFDKDNLSRNESLGTVEFDLGALPLREEQDLWLDLTNAQSGQIHLKVTVTPPEGLTITKSGTAIVQAAPVASAIDKEKEKAKAKSKAPPSPFLPWLDVHLVEGENLIVGDFKSSDPYAVIELSGQKATSHVIESNLNPFWDEHLLLHAPTTSIKSHFLNITVYDKDDANRDDLLGKASFDIDQLKPYQLHDVWLDLTGVKSGRVHLKLLYQPAVTIKLVEASNLSITDFKTSDPYVTFALANQTIKSTGIYYLLHYFCLVNFTNQLFF